jgi:hypothetical protein
LSPLQTLSDASHSPHTDRLTTPDRGGALDESGGGQRPFPPRVAKRSTKGEALVDWTIAILPPYHLVNSLPCPIQVYL